MYNNGIMVVAVYKNAFAKIVIAISQSERPQRDQWGIAIHNIWKTIINNK